MKVKKAKNIGFCWGVKRALKMAEDLLSKEQIIYMLGPLVHNEKVVKDLEKRGMKVVDDLGKIPDGAVLLIRAHGVGPSIYSQAEDKALEVIDNLNSFFISVVTYIELVQGMRNKKELNELRKALRIWNTRILYISEEISAKAMFYIERHYLSHSLLLADALIASTAIVNGLPLLTGNDKHYKIIKEIDLKTFRP